MFTFSLVDFENATSIEKRRHVHVLMILYGSTYTFSSQAAFYVDQHAGACFLAAGRVFAPQKATFTFAPQKQHLHRRAEQSLPSLLVSERITFYASLYALAYDE